MLLFLIWIQLLIFSLVTGAFSSTGQRIRLVVYHLTPASHGYTFGLVHRQFDGMSPDGEIRWVVDKITLGFIFIALEFEFYKRQHHPEEQDAPPPGEQSALV